MSETPTLLERQLAGDGTNVTALDAFRLARRKFLRGDRVDMQELAAEIGVSRATLYRWVGGREQLIGEVLWSLTETTIERARRDATGDGADWVLQVYEWGAQMATFEPLRRFIEAEPEAAMRVMMSKEGAQQRRMIGAWESILTEAIEHHGLEVRLDVPTLAYVMVRIGESFLWTDLITGEKADFNKATEVARVLLT